MPKPPAKLADHVATVNAHLLRTWTRLQTGELSGAELHEYADLLGALAEALHLYADKLDIPPATAKPPDQAEPPAR